MIFLPSNVFLLLAIFLFARARIVFRLVYPYKFFLLRLGKKRSINKRYKKRFPESVVALHRVMLSDTTIFSSSLYIVSSKVGVTILSGNIRLNKSVRNPALSGVEWLSGSCFRKRVVDLVSMPTTPWANSDWQKCGDGYKAHCSGCSTSTNNGMFVEICHLKIKIVLNFTLRLISCVHYRANKLGFAVPLVEVFQWCRGSIAARKATGPGSIPGWD